MLTWTHIPITGLTVAPRVSSALTVVDTIHALYDRKILRVCACACRRELGMEGGPDVGRAHKWDGNSIWTRHHDNGSWFPVFYYKSPEDLVADWNGSYYHGWEVVLT